MHSPAVTEKTSPPTYTLNNLVAYSDYPQAFLVHVVPELQRSRHFLPQLPVKKKSTNMERSRSFSLFPPFRLRLSG